MLTDNDVRLRKIQRISGILRVVCKAFFVMLVIFSVVMLWELGTNWGDHHGLGFTFGLDNYLIDLHELSFSSRCVLGGYLALMSAAVFLTVYYVHRLLGNYSRGEIFSTDSAMRIRRWGLACVLGATVEFMGCFVPGTLRPHPTLSSANPPLQTYGLFGFEMEVPGVLWINGTPVQPRGGDLMMSGLIIIGISWFAGMAVEMREESELTV